LIVGQKGRADSFIVGIALVVCFRFRCFRFPCANMQNGDNLLHHNQVKTCENDAALTIYQQNENWELWMRRIRNANIQANHNVRH